MSGPAISILLPVHNGAKYLSKLIPTLLANCRSGDEIIVISDGSTDETNSILRENSQLNPQIIFIEQDKMGLVRTLNNGISIARNDWIARFDVDDSYPADRLDIQRELISDKNVAIFADYSLFSEGEDYLGSIPSGITPSAVKLSLLSANRTAHPVVIFNKNAVIDVGGYRPEDYLAEDLSLWMKLSQTGDLVSVPHNLLNYQLGKNSITRLHRLQSRQVRDRLIGDFVDKVDVMTAYDRFSETKVAYLSCSMGLERSMLHLSEIQHASKLQSNSKLKASDFARRWADLAGSSNFSVALSKLAYYKAKRQIYYTV